MDIRYALRQLRRQPRFALLAVATLALGIGATAAVYAVVDAVYLKPLPYSEPDTIVTTMIRTGSRGTYGVAAGVFIAVGQLPAIQYSAASVSSDYTMEGGVVPQQVRGEQVSADYFAVFGVPAAIGRTLNAGDGTSNPAIVLSDALWRRAFGAAPDVIGRTVRLNAVVHTIVGVMPRTFLSLEGSQYWAPLELRSGDLPIMDRGPFDAFARLVTSDIEMAQRQASAVSSRLPVIDGESSEVILAPIAESVVTVPPSTLLTLLGAVSLVLLIACGNVANLLLVRGRARSGELLVRAALGATRGRLLRQLLTESLILAAAAALAGVALAAALIQVMMATAVPDMARLADVTVDWRVVAFAITLASASVLLFGLGPAALTIWRPGRLESGRSTTSSRNGRRASKTLIGGEVALTLALLIGSGLVLGRLQSLLWIDVGFETQDLHVGSLRPSGIGYDATSRFYGAVIDELRRGGHDAAVMSRMPLHRFIPPPVEIQNPTGGGPPVAARMRIASAGALTLLRVPIVRGRDIDDQDPSAGEGVALVNSILAAQLAPQADIVGGVVTVRIDRKEQRLRVIGVTADFRDSYFRAARPELYVNASQFPSSIAHVVIRGKGPAAAIEAGMQQAVSRVDGRQAIADVTTAVALGRAQTAYSRFIGMLVVAFAGFAVLLAMSGVASVVAASITERTRELGIRISLGAAPRQLAVLVLREVTAPVVIGALAGLLAAYNFSHLVPWLMAGVRQFDPVTYGAALVVLLGVAGLAAWLPLRSAYRIDPAVVLRAE